MDRSQLVESQGRCQSELYRIKFLHHEHSEQTKLKKVNKPNKRKPYPEWADRTYEFPRGYRMPDFSLFNGEREQSTIDHIARFTTQCSDQNPLNQGSKIVEK